MTTAVTPHANSLAAGRLPGWAGWATALICIGGSAALFALTSAGGGEPFNAVGAGIVAAILFAVLFTLISRVVEGPRKATDRLAMTLVSAAFIIALLPLVSLLWTVVENGLHRFDAEFFTSSLRNVIGPGGGALHAIIGTVEITLMATLISVPIGLLTSIYLVEYAGTGRLGKAITFLVDVMTGIPSIVAGLFVFALFGILFGPGTTNGMAGAVALSVLMIPVVVRSSEEMLRLVPNELREASYALGVPKYLTILKVVLRTSLAGITTGVMLAISRVIGETAPLLIVSGYTDSMVYGLWSGNMATLPVFVYQQYSSPGLDQQAYIDRSWTAALVLILIVMLLNIIARIVAKVFSPKLR